MTDLFLIAHKVRGDPAFDVAHQMLCPHCNDDSTERTECVECDGLGYWWIIPTSGHRAYPWWHIKLTLRASHIDPAKQVIGTTMHELPSMPPGLPDHYATRATPTISLAEALGIRPAPSAPIVRRF